VTGIALAAAFAAQGRAQQQDPPPSTPPTTNAASASALVPVKRFRATDADNHVVTLNKQNVVTLLLYTSEDSQDAAQRAGREMYPLQGRMDFQLVVVVDLRDSIATWAPSIAVSEMRARLDKEAVTLKPYFLQNHNKSNPRDSSYVIPDFNGATCTQLGWTEGSDELRGILFGADGREIKRWEKIKDMGGLFNDVRAAIQVFIDTSRAKATAAAAKPQGTKLIQPPMPPIPLPPPAPPDNPG
jgi:hypothetical protein